MTKTYDIELHALMDLDQRRALSDTGKSAPPDYGRVGHGFYLDGEVNQNADEDALFLEIAMARTMIKKEQTIRWWLDLHNFDWLTGEASEMEKTIRGISRLGDRRHRGPVR